MDCCHTEEHTNHAEMHHEHHGHTQHSHEHQGSGMSHGSAEMFLQRFWIVTVLLIPLAFTNAAIMYFFNLPLMPYARYVGFAITTVIFGFALIFFQHAWHEIKAQAYGMMTLVSLAVGAGYTFSVVATFVPTLQADFYIEISTLIWVLLFGHYLEAKSGAAAGNALSEVGKLLPKHAHVVGGTDENDIPVEDLRIGDIVLVKTGEKIPADGVVVDGGSHTNESLISGESKAVLKGKGDEVVAGSICLDGILRVRVARVGENSTVGQIKSLIAKAQMTKPNSQKIADKASAVLTFVALGVSLCTLAFWTLVLGHSFLFAATLAITVLVIACPHALGLAIPTVTTIATSLAVKHGVFIKNLAKIEVIKGATYVVFDKTGTLTNGSFEVTDVQTMGEYDVKDVLAMVGSLEKESAHIIGQAIVTYAKEKDIQLEKITEFQTIAGKGISAMYKGMKAVVGNEEMMALSHISIDSMKKEYEKLVDTGNTVVLVASGDTLAGMVALSDKIKEESKQAIIDLHDLGIKIAMLTGDNDMVASGVAKELSIDTYVANVLPEDKYTHVKALQEKGEIVLMVGDGINDAPALTQADAGIAIGAGTDVALEAGDVVLTRSNPNDIVSLVRLSRAVYHKMIQNLVWALGYNIIAIPSAAGVFAMWGFFLRPEIGALIMSLSTVIVVANALSLRRLKLS